LLGAKVSHSQMAMRYDPAKEAAQLRHRLDATPELVFAAFADPSLVRLITFRMDGSCT